jgi:hypothetical protein
MAQAVPCSLSLDQLHTPQIVQVEDAFYVLVAVYDYPRFLTVLRRQPVHRGCRG